MLAVGTKAHRELVTMVKGTAGYNRGPTAPATCPWSMLTLSVSTGSLHFNFAWGWVEVDRAVVPWADRSSALVTGEEFLTSREPGVPGFP